MLSAYSKLFVSACADVAAIAMIAAVIMFFIVIPSLSSHAGGLKLVDSFTKSAEGNLYCLVLPRIRAEPRHYRVACNKVLEVPFIVFPEFVVSLCVVIMHVNRGSIQPLPLAATFVKCLRHVVCSYRYRPMGDNIKAAKIRALAIYAHERTGVAVLAVSGGGV